jgi:hypothetical protein
VGVCGLDINAECQDDDLDPRTPLCVAYLNENVDVCKYLLAAGAKAEAAYQPLTAAARVYYSYF